MKQRFRSLMAEALLAFMGCIRPLLGPEKMCIFHEKSCTAYAAEQIKKEPLWRAIPQIVWRFLRCNPITGLFSKSWPL